jgi:hypothetical protein
MNDFVTKLVNEKYPMSKLYKKNGIWYLTDSTNNTIGSGMTITDAYEMAADNILIEEENEQHK